MKRWAVYCGGNSAYILSENREPIRMLNSFKAHFGDKLDYIYFTDKDEPNLDVVQLICDSNDIKLIVGECKEHYNQYKDIEYLNANRKERWPDAHYWYCEAPEYFKDVYDFVLKCDGDMMCNSHFDLLGLEYDSPLSIAKAPDWYDAFDKYSANAGFQIINVQRYTEEKISSLFREASKQIGRFNSDTPALDYFVGSNQIIVTYVSSEYNYLLFDLGAVTQLKLEDVSTVKIFHFVDSKPHNLNPNMIGSIKEYFSKIYLKY